MVFDINSFKSALRYGGARTSLFRVQISNPANPVADLQLPFLCHATSLPAVNIAKIAVSHAGRQIQVGGKQSFESWAVDIYNDEDFKIRNAMEQWANSINSFETNTRLFASSEAALYKSTATVSSFSQTGEELRTYKIVGIFPTAVGAIELNWNGNEVQTFNVQFSLDYFYVDRSITNEVAGGI